MLIILDDVNGNQVKIDSAQIGDILTTAYYGEYDGEDAIEKFIDWISDGCPDI